MEIQVMKSELDGILIIEPDIFRDDRGFFTESYSKRAFQQHGLDYTFVQDNHSRSKRGVLRGFHYQDKTAPQYRLVRCTLGEIWDVVVDLREGSPTLGKWLGISLTSENRKQILIAPEFAHAFVTISEFAEVQYKCTNFHTPSAEKGLFWNDPDIGVLWPLKDPILSSKDSNQMSFSEYLKNPCF
jgi:dTDP-4-dehydrorhamnose 3,5-epimerase